MRFKLRGITLLLLAGIGAGLFLGRDYGLSWDEHFHKVYAEHTVETFLGQRAPGDTLTDLRFYGPAFSVPWLILRNLLTDLVPGLGSADAGHLVYWLAFLPAPLLIYALGLRHVDRTAALARAPLFASPPPIFGHALVNPVHRVGVRGAGHRPAPGSVRHGCPRCLEDSPGCLPPEGKAILSVGPISLPGGRNRAGGMAVLPSAWGAGFSGVAPSPS